MFTIIGSGKDTELYVVSDRDKNYTSIKGKDLEFLIKMLNASGVKFD